MNTLHELYLCALPDNAFITIWGRMSVVPQLARSTAHVSQGSERAPQDLESSASSVYLVELNIRVCGRCAYAIGMSADYIHIRTADGKLK
jgi:hypothetical protein